MSVFKHFKNPYNKQLDKTLKEISIIYKTHQSNGLFCCYSDKNELVSLVMYDTQNFPFEDSIIFHVEMFTSNKFIGLTNILKSLKLLEDKFADKRLISRHSITEISTLLMLNDLSYLPIQWSQDGERNVLVQKLSKSETKKTFEIISANKDQFNELINGWLNYNLNLINNSSIEPANYELLDSNGVTIIEHAKTFLILYDKNRLESIVFISKPLTRKECLHFLYFLENNCIKDLYINSNDFRLMEILFLRYFVESGYIKFGFNHWQKCIKIE